jgi:glycerol-1-phosphate dehydrogenase [NAD(P)+]
MQNIYDLDEYLALNPSQLADTNFHCPECGREHIIPIKIVSAGENLLAKLPVIIETILIRKPNKIGIVYDRQIEEKLEYLFFTPFVSLDMPFIKFPLEDNGVLLDSTVEIGDETANEIPKEVDILIGLGSGVICDLTKWIATTNNLPFILVGTAASMNAYTSITATMVENKVKSSVLLDPTSAVLLDSGLLVSAPYEMTCAGIGDLLARNVSNADWMLSKILRETYFCSIPFRMMVTCQDDLLSKVGLLKKNDETAMRSLGDALLLSGYSMAILISETSPSSGSEHVISHFFDFQHEVFNLPKNLHGVQVGIGTIIMSTAYDMLREMTPSDFDLDEIINRRLSQAEINLDLKHVFGNYHAKFEEVSASKRVPDGAYRHYLENILQSWKKIWESLDPFLMPADDLFQVMEEASAITKLSGIKRTKEDAIQALLYGPHYRQRYTILDLYWELGLFPDYAPKILERSKVLG